MPPAPPARRENVGRNKLAQFRQPYGKRPAAMPELRKLGETSPRWPSESGSGFVEWASRTGV